MAESAACYGLTHPANDRYKAQRGVRLTWSVGAAVVLHGLAVLLSPSWTAAVPPGVLVPPRPFELALIRPAERMPSGDVASSELLPAGMDPTQEDSPAGAEERSNLEGPGEGDLSRAFGEGLFGRVSPVPTVTVPDDRTKPEMQLETVEPDDSDEEGDANLGGSAFATDLLSVPEGDGLDLDRLAELRPELALLTPSSWLLIRNPVEVEEFMRSSYRSGDVDPDASGLVGVTLWINESGSVEWAEVSRSSGRSDLDEVALELFNEVVAFRPARERGVSVSTSAIFWVTFPMVSIRR